MDLGGYSNIPDTLPEAQAALVAAWDQMRELRRVAAESLAAETRAVNMIVAARRALNAVEKPIEAEPIF